MATARAASNRQWSVRRGNGIFGQTVLPGHKTIRIFVTALRTRQPEMSAFESIRHTAGGDTERFHYESSEDEGQDEGGNQPFEGIRHLGRPIFLLIGGLVGSFFLSLVCRHKQ